MRFVAVGLWAGLRVVRRLAYVLIVTTLLLVVIGVAQLARELSSAPGQSVGGAQFRPGPQYSYPTPSYWPLSPYPVGSARAVPTPRVTVLPCPSYVPPGGWLYSPAPPSPVPTIRPDGQQACDIPGGVPPDPKTGPVLASPTSGR